MTDPKQDLPTLIARVRDDAWGSACSERGPVETARILATALEEQMAEVERLRAMARRIARRRPRRAGGREVMAKCDHCNSENCTYDAERNAEIVEMARLRQQRAVLRREVRRLNAKVAAQAAVLQQLGSSDHWQAVRAMAAKPVLDGAAMWELRKALGLTACEVSHDDVIRAAARRLALEGKP